MLDPLKQESGDYGRGDSEPEVWEDNLWDVVTDLKTLVDRQAVEIAALSNKMDQQANHIDTVELYDNLGDLFDLM
jgi:hypothetical protein